MTEKSSGEINDQTPKSYPISGDELASVYLNQVYKRYIENKPALLFPRFVILGGQPGAGKSVTADKLLEEFKKAALDPVHVDIDRLRVHHPRLEEITNTDPMNMGLHTHEVAGELSGFILEDAKAIKNNILFEVTLGNVDWLQNEIGLFQKDGYAVDLHVMAVHESISRLGLFQRFEKAVIANKASDPPRLVPVSYHDNAYKALPDNVDRLERNCNLSIVSVNNRKGTILYERENQIGLPGAKQAILLERERAWTNEERTQHLKDWANVLREAHARPADEKLKPDFYIATLEKAAMMAMGYPQITLSLPASEQDLSRNIITPTGLDFKKQ